MLFPAFLEANIYYYHLLFFFIFENKIKDLAHLAAILS